VKPEPDFYEFLQVHPAAEAEVIDAAFRRLARKYRPAVNKDPKAARRMREINAAFEILSDPVARAEYDRRRSRGASTGDGPTAEERPIGISSQRSRRRRRPSTQPAAAEADRRPPLLKSRDVAAVAVLVAVTFLLMGIALLTSGGTGEGGTAAGGAGAIPPAGGTPASDTGAATDTGAPTAGEQPTAADEEAIRALARRSIEVLPAGQWPSLYDSYTSEFQQRCPREEFDQAGVDAAADLGDNLRLLRFKRLESVTIEDSSAQAVITGEIAGQGEYEIQAAFQKEGGDWKIAPAAGTQGCQAFLSS